MNEVFAVIGNDNKASVGLGSQSLYGNMDRWAVTGSASLKILLDAFP